MNLGNTDLSPSALLAALGGGRVGTLPALEALNLGGNGLGSGVGLGQLAAGLVRSCPSLVRLDLRYNDLGDGGRQPWPGPCGRGRLRLRLRLRLRSRSCTSRGTGSGTGDAPPSPRRSPRGKGREPWRSCTWARMASGQRGRPAWRVAWRLGGDSGGSGRCSSRGTASGRGGRRSWPGPWRGCGPRPRKRQGGAEGRAARPQPSRSGTCTLTTTAAGRRGCRGSRLPSTAEARSEGWKEKGQSNHTPTLGDDQTPVFRSITVLLASTRGGVLLIIPGYKRFDSGFGALIPCGDLKIL